LGVADPGLVTDDAEDVGWAARVVDGIAQGLAVNGEASTPD
jgi:hypothetical protein